MSKREAAVFCDIGDVLIASARTISAAARTAVGRCTRAGFDIDGEAFLEAYIEADRQTARPHVNHLFGDRLIAAAALARTENASDLRYVGAFLTYYREYIRATLKPSPEVSHFFRALAGLHGVGLGIISDGTTDDQLEILTRLEIIAFLDRGMILISEDVGTEKSGSAIFVEALKRAACPPERVFMIGDNPERDARIPKALGMRTILFTGHKDNGPCSDADHVCASLEQVLAALRAEILGN